MATRYERYVTDIRRQWDWVKLEREAEKAAREYDAATLNEDGDEYVGREWLGTIFAITPSGKMYAPFATGNLAVCKRCNGRGHVVNRKQNRRRWLAARRERTALTQTWAGAGHLYAQWPAEVQARAQLLDKRMRDTDRTLPCTWCRGTGAPEAARDEDWHAALGHVAKQHGLYVEHIDDGIFVCTTVPKEHGDWCFDPSPIPMSALDADVSVLDTALSPDHTLSDVSEGALYVECENQDGDVRAGVVICYTMDTSGKRDTPDLDDADIIRDWCEECDADETLWRVVKTRRVAAG